jgi:hypothetical protein
MGGSAAVGWGEAQPSAAVGTPITFQPRLGSGAAAPWCSVRACAGNCAAARPTPPPRLRATAAALQGTQPSQGCQGPGCLARMLRPGRRGELRRPAPLASAPPPQRSRGCRRCRSAAATADGQGCRARAALGSAAVGRRLHTDQTYRTPWAAALQRSDAWPLLMSLYAEMPASGGGDC